MLLAPPVLDHEAKAVRIEEETFGIPRPWRSQVDEKHNRKLEALGGMDRQQRNSFGGRGFLRRLTHRQLRIDHLVEMADEVADSGERKVALESARQLEDLAQVEQSPRAAVPLGAQLGPAQVAAFLKQAIQDVRNGERV